MGWGWPREVWEASGKVCEERPEQPLLFIYFFFTKEDNNCFLAVRHTEAAVPGESDPVSDAPGDE